MVELYWCELHVIYKLILTGIIILSNADNIYYMFQHKSRNIPTINTFNQLLQKNKTFKSKEELVKIFKSVLKQDFSSKVVFSCGSGVTASVFALAYSLLDNKYKPVIYVGSWSEYGGQPWAKGPWSEYKGQPWAAGSWSENEGQPWAAGSWSEYEGQAWAAGSWSENESQRWAAGPWSEYEGQPWATTGGSQQR